LAVNKWALAGVLLTSLTGCARAEPAVIPKEQNTVEALLADVAGKNSLEDAIGADDADLRRAFAPNDMKLHGCVKLIDGATLVGTGCPSTFVVFGPYVRAPANSDVRVHFDIESRDVLKVVSDFVSSNAKQFHGATEDQILKPEVPATLGYRIHVFDSAAAVEARVGVQSNKPVNFTITNFALTIQ
jgi:hypothetical protein